MNRNEPFVMYLRNEPKKIQLAPSLQIRMTLTYVLWDGSKGHKDLNLKAKGH